MALRDRLLMVTGCGAIAAATLYFVYPTPYEYTRKAPDIWRVNRLSGIKEIATDTGWKTVSELYKDLASIRENHGSSNAAHKQKASSDAEKIKVEFSRDWWTVPISNPTETPFRVKRVTVEYWSADADGKRKDKLSSDHYDPDADVPANSASRVDIVQPFNRNLPSEVKVVLPKPVIQVVKVEFWEDAVNDPAGPFWGETSRQATSNQSN